MTRTQALTLAAAVTLSGCGSRSENVAEREAEWSQLNADTHAKMGQRERVELTWEKAHAELLRGSPELLAARANILTADAQIDRVWLDLLPASSLSYSLDRSLSDIAARGNGQLSIFAFINIPGVVSTRMRYYGAVLSKIRAEYAYDLAVREQTLALWNAYRDSRRLDDRAAWAKLARSRNLLAGTGGTAALSELLNEHTLRKERDALQDRVGSLLGDMTKEYRLVHAGLPAPDYRDDKLDLRDTKKVGLLAMKLAATELEGGRLRRMGATLAFWPDVSAGISGPPLYSNGTNGESVWSAKEARAQANLTWRLDTQLAAVYSLAETKRQVALMRNRLILQNQERIRRLETTRNAMRTLRRRADDVDRRLSTVMAAPPATDFNSYSAWSNELRSLIVERERLGAEADALNAVFWFVEESRWPVTHPEASEEADAAEFARLNAILDNYEE